MADSDYRIFALVLAAGRGRRFGATKQLVEIDGQTLVARSARLARRVCGDRSVLVAGHDWQAVADAAGDACRFLVVNEIHERGLGTSIAAGVSAVRHAADAILLLLADQPLVTGEHLEALCACWSGDPREIVASNYAGTRGPPVILPRDTFDDLVRLDGDRGANRLFEDRRFAVETVPFEPAAVDVDTPADLESLR